MILLDTNVLSALMRTEPDVVVVDWLDTQPSESIWTTSVTLFEIRTALELLPSSRRRRHLEDAFERVLSEDLDDRVVSFDSTAANAAGSLVARRQRAGRSVEIRDAQIAGIALARKATVATGNVRHFRDLGVRLVDPWRT
jgi:toxin FitB